MREKEKMPEFSAGVTLIKVLSFIKMGSMQKEQVWIEKKIKFFIFGYVKFDIQMEMYRKQLDTWDQSRGEVPRLGI